MGIVRKTFKLVFGEFLDGQRRDEEYRREFSEKRKQFDAELKQTQDRIDSVRESIRRTKQ